MENIYRFEDKVYVRQLVCIWDVLVKEFCVILLLWRWSVIQKHENDSGRASIVGMASEHLVHLCSYSDVVKKEEQISLEMGTLIQSRVCISYGENGQISGCWTPWWSCWLIWYVFYVANEGRGSCVYLAVLLPLHEQEVKSPFIYLDKKMQAINNVFKLLKLNFLISFLRYYIFLSIFPSLYKNYFSSLFCLYLPACLVYFKWV